MLYMENRGRILIAAMGMILFPLTSFSSAYAAPIETRQQSVEKVSASFAPKQPDDAGDIHTAITSSPKSGKTDASNDVVSNISDIKDSDDEARLRVQILKALRDAHAQGEYEDITEDMIMNLSGRELKGLVMNEYLASKDTWDSAQAALPLRATEAEDVPTTETIDDIDYADLYSYPEKVRTSLFPTIRDYAAEKKESMALLALGAGGGFMLMRRGRRLLDIETEADAAIRHQKLFDVIHTPVDANEIFRKRDEHNPSDVAEDCYKTMIKPKFSEADNLRNLTEMYTASGLTLKQEQKITEHMNAAFDKQAPAMPEIYQSIISEMRNSDQYEYYSDEELPEVLAGELNVVYGKGGEKIVESMRTGNLGHFQRSHNMSERLENCDKAIETIMHDDD